MNWVLDADIRGFFDAMAHSWIIRFLEHRIADKRILRLIAKWLKVGRDLCGGRRNPRPYRDQAADSSARFEIILPAVLPVGKCRSSGLGGRVHQRRRALHSSFTLPRSTPDHNRYRVVVHRFPVDTLSAVDGHLHANPIFFRTLSNPVSWNVASWPGPCPLNTLIFSRAPSGSDRRSSTASFL